MSQPCSIKSSIPRFLRPPLKLEPIKYCSNSEVESLGYLQVQFFDSVTGRQQLLVTGISLAELSGSQAITKVIKEIREELRVSGMTKFQLLENK